MSSNTTAAPALHVPALQPVPVEGCSVCAAAGRQRSSARGLGSIVSEQAADETIRQHPHRRATDQRGAAR